MDNKALLSKFLDYLKANAISEKRILKYQYTLTKMAKILKKPYDKATKEDLIKVVAWIEEQPYTAWTKHDYKVCLKRLFKWLKGNDEEFPNEVKWIKATVKRNNSKLPEELLTEDDIDAMINTATNIRNKAFICVLYESGCRIGELINLKIKHITFDEYSPVIIVNGKTGTRRIRLIDKQELLKTWLKAHPFKDNPDAYVWVSMANNRKNQPLDYHTIGETLRVIAEESGVKKKVNPHNFRHSRATYLASKLTESQLKQMFGWIQSSKMASIYVHLSGRDLDEPLLKMSGLLNEELEKEQNLLRTIDGKLKDNPEFRLKFAKLLLESGIKA